MISSTIHLTVKWQKPSLFIAPGDLVDVEDGRDNIMVDNVGARNAQKRTSSAQSVSASSSWSIGRVQSSERERVSIVKLIYKLDSKRGVLYKVNVHLAWLSFHLGTLAAVVGTRGLGQWFSATEARTARPLDLGKYKNKSSTGTVNSDRMMKYSNW